MASHASSDRNPHGGRRRRPGPRSLTRGLSWGFASLAALFLGGLLAVFLVQSLPVWREVGVGYLTGTTWFYRLHQFGTLPMIYGTVAVSVIALLWAVPLGVGAAIFTAEILPARPRLAVKIAVELLAGIPSVVYGLLGILFLRNWVYQLLASFDPLSGDSLLTAGLLVGVMVLPTVLSLSDDALRGVSALQRQAARGLGLNRAETIVSVVLPQAGPGIAAAVLLAFGRSLGEMIAVFLVVGRQDNQWPEPLWSLRPLMESGQTLASKLGSSETNLAYGDPLHWAAMVSLGLVLLILVGGVTALAFRLLRRESHA